MSDEIDSKRRNVCTLSQALRCLTGSWAKDYWLFRANFGANFPARFCVQCRMKLVAQLTSETITRLGKQAGFLLRLYQAELAKDPTSRASESSRSNLIAAEHTVKQIYGESVARDVANRYTDWI